MLALLFPRTALQSSFAAIEEARKFTPDVILLDIGLPDFKGHVIARQLRFEPELKNTKIIAITGSPDDLRQQALDAGCAEFYRKPIDPAKLEELLSPVWVG